MITTHRMLWGAAALALLTCAPAPALADVKEPSSGESFSESRGGQALLGVGIRKKWGFKVYAIGLYADKEAASKVAAGDAAAVARGGFGKTVEIRMQRNVGADKFKGAFEDSMASVKGTPEFGQFLGAFKNDLAKGSKVIIKLSGGTVTVDVAGSKTTISSGNLATALINVWLGPRPIDKTLRSNLVARLGSL